MGNSSSNTYNISGNNNQIKSDVAQTTEVSTDLDVKLSKGINNAEISIDPEIYMKLRKFIKDYNNSHFLKGNLVNNFINDNSELELIIGDDVNKFNKMEYNCEKMYNGLVRQGAALKGQVKLNLTMIDQLNKAKQQINTVIDGIDSSDEKYDEYKGLAKKLETYMNRLTKNSFKDNGLSQKMSTLGLEDVCGGEKIDNKNGSDDLALNVMTGEAKAPLDDTLQVVEALQNQTTQCEIDVAIQKAVMNSATNSIPGFNVSPGEEYIKYMRDNIDVQYHRFIYRATKSVGLDHNLVCTVNSKNDSQALSANLLQEFMNNMNTENITGDQTNLSELIYQQQIYKMLWTRKESWKLFCPPSDIKVDELNMVTFEATGVDAYQAYDLRLFDDGSRIKAGKDYKIGNNTVWDCAVFDSVVGENKIPLVNMFDNKPGFLVGLYWVGFAMRDEFSRYNLQTTMQILSSGTENYLPVVIVRPKGSNVNYGIPLNINRSTAGVSNPIPCVSEITLSTSTLDDLLPPFKSVKFCIGVMADDSRDPNDRYGVSVLGIQGMHSRLIFDDEDRTLKYWIGGPDGKIDKPLIEAFFQNDVKRSVTPAMNETENYWQFFIQKYAPYVSSVIEILETDEGATILDIFRVNVENLIIKTNDKLDSHGHIVEDDKFDHELAKRFFIDTLLEIKMLMLYRDNSILVHVATDGLKYYMTAFLVALESLVSIVVYNKSVFFSKSSATKYYQKLALEFDKHKAVESSLENVQNISDHLEAAAPGLAYRTGYNSKNKDIHHKIINARKSKSNAEYNKFLIKRMNSHLN